MKPSAGAAGSRECSCSCTSHRDQACTITTHGRQLVDEAAICLSCELLHPATRGASNTLQGGSEACCAPCCSGVVWLASSDASGGGPSAGRTSRSIRRRVSIKYKCPCDNGWGHRSTDPLREALVIHGLQCSILLAGARHDSFWQLLSSCHLQPVSASLWLPAATCGL